MEMNMSKEITLKDTLSIIEKVQELTETFYNKTKNNRFVALNVFAHRESLRVRMVIKYHD